MGDMVVKDSMSFEGWEFRKWLRGNWKTIKEIVKVGAPYLLGWITTRDPYIAGFVALVGKFLLDAGEYYIKERTA